MGCGISSMSRSSSTRVNPTESPPAALDIPALGHAFNRRTGKIGGRLLHFRQYEQQAKLVEWVPLGSLSTMMVRQLRYRVPTIATVTTGGVDTSSASSCQFSSSEETVNSLAHSHGFDEDASLKLKAKLPQRAKMALTATFGASDIRKRIQGWFQGLKENTAVTVAQRKRVVLQAAIHACPKQDLLNEDFRCQLKGLSNAQTLDDKERSKYLQMIDVYGTDIIYDVDIGGAEIIVDTANRARYASHEQEADSSFTKDSSAFGVSVLGLGVAAGRKDTGASETQQATSQQRTEHVATATHVRSLSEPIALLQLGLLGSVGRRVCWPISAFIEDEVVRWHWEEAVVDYVLQDVMRYPGSARDWLEVLGRPQGPCTLYHDCNPQYAYEAIAIRHNSESLTILPLDSAKNYIMLHGVKREDMLEDNVPFRAYKVGANIARAVFTLGLSRITVNRTTCYLAWPNPIATWHVLGLVVNPRTMEVDLRRAYFATQPLSKKAQQLWACIASGSTPLELPETGYNACTIQVFGGWSTDMSSGAAPHFSMRMDLSETPLRLNQDRSRQTPPKKWTPHPDFGPQPVQTWRVHEYGFECEPTQDPRWQGKRHPDGSRPWLPYESRAQCGYARIILRFANSSNTLH